MKNAKTLSSRTIMTAVRLFFPGEMGKHAVSEGIKAITKFSSSDAGTSKDKISKTKRSNLTFSVSRVQKFLRTYFNRISKTASVYLAAVFEYLTAEILELSGNAARDLKKKNN